MKKVVSIVGARPQFVKCAILYNELKKYLNNVLINTGQHYDDNMSKIFFRELDISEINYDLNIGSGSHGEQTAKMLTAIEGVLINERPNIVVVYGDTNSTLAGALAASKLQIPIVHVEAGLRSFNKSMPEEINRVVTDHVSDLLFAPTKTAISNLEKEGLLKKSYLTGDIMYDAILEFSKMSSKTNILKYLQLNTKDYYLLTLHRPYNVDDRNTLKEILGAFGSIDKRIIFPIHPRTKKMIEKYGIEVSNNINLIPPVGYLELIELEKNAKKIITDSGGIQKEAYFLKVPCITLRSETEWVETLDDKMNILVKDRGKDSIIEAIKSEQKFVSKKEPFGNGDSAKIMSKMILDYLN